MVVSGLSPRELYEKYAPCVVAITSRDRLGNVSIGTGFHLGDGYVATARHVVEQRSDLQLRSHYLAKVSRISDIMLPKSGDDDVALLPTDFSLRHYMERTTTAGHPPHLKTDHIPLPAMMSDWIGNELVMTVTIMLGFPPIPTSNEPVLVAARGEIMAVIEPYLGSQHPLFVTSSLPRGGFSGGPVLSEFDFALGICTESLVGDGRDLSLGFGAVVSRQPIWDLLFQERIFPASNVEMAYLLRYGYDVDVAIFNLTNEQRERLDATLDEAGPEVS